MVQLLLNDDVELEEVFAELLIVEGLDELLEVDVVLLCIKLHLTIVGNNEIVEDELEVLELILEVDVDVDESEFVDLVEVEVDELDNVIATIEDDRADDELDDELELIDDELQTIDEDDEDDDINQVTLLDELDYNE